MILGIYIDNQRIDLFDDEQIKVKSSVLDIQDIEKNTTDYSNSFTVPASAANNKIFQHYYNADIDDGFDARIKHPARIELGGIPFKVGNIILQNVKMLHGAPSSYMLTFFGDLASLADIFGDTKLGDLDFASYPDQEYNSDYVKGNLTGSKDALISALIAKRRLYYSTDSTDTNSNNIASNTETTNGVQWNELRFAMRLDEIITEIETYFGLTFSNEIFHSERFFDLYLHLDNEALDVSDSRTAISGIDFFYCNDGLVNVAYAIEITTVIVTLDINPVDDTQAYTMYAYDGNDDLILSREVADGGDGQIILNYTLESSADESEVYFVVESESPLYLNANISYDISDSLGGSAFFEDNANQLITHDYSITDAMPNITVAEFIKGLISAFYCVAIKDGSAVYVDNVEEYYNSGNIIDLTKYADNSELPIYRPDLLNEINYSFQDGTTLLQSTFYAKNGVYYGNEELKIYDDNGDLITGSTKDIELPFEQMVYERLLDADNGDRTTISVGASIDEDGEPTIMSPHIFYAEQRSVSANPIAFVEDTGANTELSGNVFMPTHLDSNSGGRVAFLFGVEYGEFTGVPLTSNLYSYYHSAYITKLFNKKTRRYELTCSNVPLSILTTLQLNDTIKVRTDYFRINSNTINLTTGSITLDLLR